jgi:hypothetical protein
MPDPRGWRGARAERALEPVVTGRRRPLLSARMLAGQRRLFACSPPLRPVSPAHRLDGQRCLLAGGGEPLVAASPHRSCSLDPVDTWSCNLI